MSNETIQVIQFLSSSFAGLFLFLGIIWWLLCIILFFKVWGMTNDVSKMKDMLREQLDLEHPYVENTAPDQPATQDK